jgi:hypothetical protein
MHVSIRLPGPRATDMRNTVTFQDDSLPQPLSLHYLRIRDDETGGIELRMVGFELGAPPRPADDALAMHEVTALTLRHIVERFPHWVELGRAHIGAADLNLAGGTKRVKPARLDPDWYRMIAAEYTRHLDAGDPAPVTMIANAHGVTVSAASRWVKTARERGYLPQTAPGKVTA